MSRIYLPPWRELQPNGNLGAPYGPATAATYARHVAKHADWAYRAPGRAQDHAELVKSFMAANGEAASEREREVFVLVYVTGLGNKLAAERLGVTRGSVKCYRARLVEKARMWGKGRG